MKDYYKGGYKSRYGGCPCKVFIRIKEGWKSNTSARQSKYPSPCRTNRTNHDESLERKKYEECAFPFRSFDL